MIRAASNSDIQPILNIWNPVIRDSIFTFNSREKSEEDLTALLSEKAKQNDPFLVSEENGKILGFATYGQFRAGIGYRYTVEHTIIVGEGLSGRGLGGTLMLAVEEHAKLRGMHSMIAGVSAENTAAIHFHKRMGYAEVGRLPEVGKKFDRWFELVLMQKRL